MRRITPLVMFVSLVGGCNLQQSPARPTPVASGGSVNVQSGPPIPTEETYISDSCGFPVRVDLEGKVKELPLPGDRLKVLFPGFSSSLTNVATGENIFLSTTGTFHISFLANGNTRLVYTGRNTYDDPFEGRLLFLIGNFTEEFDADFNVVQPLTGKGQMQDLCAVLAS